jgi:hypothetical protein
VKLRANLTLDEAMDSLFIFQCFKCMELRKFSDLTEGELLKDPAVLAVKIRTGVSCCSGAKEVYSRP